jgi:hypothetical protein
VSIEVISDESTAPVTKFRKHRLRPKDTHRFVEELIGDDFHAKRVLSLANGVTGTIHGATLGIHAIGQGPHAERERAERGGRNAVGHAASPGKIRNDGRSGGSRASVTACASTRSIGDSGRGVPAVAAGLRRPASAAGGTAAAPRASWASQFWFTYSLQSGMGVLPSMQLPGLCIGGYDARPFASCTVSSAPVTA